MFNYIVYKDRRGRDLITEYIAELAAKAKTSKAHRVELKKIVQYLDVLQAYGTRAGEPYVKHLEGDLWELRPSDNRIIYAYWAKNTFVLLHYFKKRTQKTPIKELERAKSNLADWIERSEL